MLNWMHALSVKLILQPYKSHFGNNSLFGWLDFSLSFGKDSDGEVATEQLTGVVDARVDVTFMPDNDPEIS